MKKIFIFILDFETFFSSNTVIEPLRSSISSSVFFTFVVLLRSYNAYPILHKL